MLLQLQWTGLALARGDVLGQGQQAPIQHCPDQVTHFYLLLTQDKIWSTWRGGCKRHGKTQVLLTPQSYSWVTLDVCPHGFGQW